MSKEQKILDEFLDLLNRAATTSSIVASAARSLKIQKSRLERLKTDQLLTEIQALGTLVIGEYDRLGGKAPDLTPEVTKLLQWIMDNSPESVEFIPDCKPPLEAGDLTFDDIAGNEEVKEDIRKNYIYPFKYPSLFKAKSKGIMLYGPPGTGKTMLAKAATAAIPGAAFFAPTPGELRGKYEGETEKNIDKVFKCAQQVLDEKNSPYKVAIIFLDEFDSLAGARGDDPGMKRSVNALLQAMDGIKAMPNVSVIAATNLPWDIDGAVRRRFSAEIFIDLPDPEAREFLARQQISKNFLRPGKKCSVYKEGSWNFNDAIFEDIEEFGQELCKRSEEVEKETKGWTGTYTEREQREVVRLVDGEFVSSGAKGRLLNRTGPNEAAAELLAKVKDESVPYSELEIEDLEDGDLKYGDLKFGYSGSDMDKLMITSIQIASARALEAGFNDIKFGGETYYYAVPAKGSKYVIFEHVRDKILGKKKPRVLSDEQARRALNFAFCQDDVFEGMEKYPSTIISKDYVNLILYKYRGITPKKKKD